jgi:hypothetical protein
MRRLLFVLTVVAIMVATAVPAFAQGFSFDTSNWTPSYRPAWCDDPYLRAAYAQYVSLDECAPGPVVR